MGRAEAGVAAQLGDACSLGLWDTMHGLKAPVESEMELQVAQLGGGGWLPAAVHAPQRQGGHMPPRYVRGVGTGCQLQAWAPFPVSLSLHLYSLAGGTQPSEAILGSLLKMLQAPCCPGHVPPTHPGAARVTTLHCLP